MFRSFKSFSFKSTFTHLLSGQARALGDNDQNIPPQCTFSVLRAVLGPGLQPGGSVRYQIIWRPSQVLGDPEELFSPLHVLISGELPSKREVRR